MVIGLTLIMAEILTICFKEIGKFHFISQHFTAKIMNFQQQDYTVC